MHGFMVEGLSTRAWIFTDGVKSMSIECCWVSETCGLRLDEGITATSDGLALQSEALNPSRILYQMAKADIKGQGSHLF